MSLILSLVEIAAVIGIGIIGDRLTARFLTRGAKREGVAEARVRSARAWLRLPWIIIVVAGIARVLGLVNELETVTVVGIVGVIITLMSEHTLTNIAAGILLLKDDLLRLDDLLNCVQESKVKW